MSQSVFLTRHGSRQDSDPNWAKTAMRPFDPGLSPEGVKQAQQLARRLTGEKVAHIFASPFLRTMETAYYIAQALALPIKVEAGLAEWLNPSWFKKAPELLPPSALVRKFPRVDLAYKSIVQPVFPETIDDLIARTSATMKALSAQYPENILLVGHGASVVGVTFSLTETPSEMNCPSCGLFKFMKRDDSWVMELNADTSHLK